jgi:hypothetical protein
MATDLVIDYSFKLADIAIIFATVAGPVLAVQAQKFLERRREKADRQADLFRTLMLTRTTVLSRRHVEALNAIQLEFYGVKEITDAWQSYFDHMNRQGPLDQVWQDNRLNLLVDMLYQMGQYLGYDFNKVKIKNEVYAPNLHAEIEENEFAIQRGLAGLFKGDKPLPLSVREMPTDPQMKEAIINFLERNGSKPALSADKPQ